MNESMNELPREIPQRDFAQRVAADRELEQPDPGLSLSTGRASALQIALTAVASIFILGLMIYGLNRPVTEPSQTASAPPAQETTGAAPQAQPAQPSAQPQQNEPAQQPQPEPQKPALPDDSKR